MKQIKQEEETPLVVEKQEESSPKLSCLKCSSTHIIDNLVTVVGAETEFVAQTRTMYICLDCGFNWTV